MFAMIEAAGAVDAYITLEAGRLRAALQRLEDFLGTSVLAAAARVRRIALVEAHENVTLEAGHQDFLAGKN
jgi:hypothetical protein